MTQPGGRPEHGENGTAERDPLAGRTALVTGSSRGIGRAIAVALAEAGADVAVNYRSRADAAAAAVDAVVAAGRRAVAVRADVADEDDLLALVETTETELGPVDVLVNNAGVARKRSLSDLDRAEWATHIDVNLTAAFLLTQAVLPHMREQGWGRLLNVSSAAARDGGSVGPHYAASKAGLHGLTRSYAKELAGEGVTANTLVPGPTDTEMVADLPVDPAFVPVGRLGEPAEVGAVARLLAENGYVTGQTYHVDGGVYFA